MADGSAAPIAADGCATEDGLDVVYFAGCGGSSEAYKIALGKHPDVALNHNEIAIGVHMANCPDTEHFVADVFDVDPTVIRPGVKWRSFWASPDCRHFSKAKGSAPVSPRIRGLAWVVIKVAKLLGSNRPDVIFLENVEEFRDWGPLKPPDEQGRRLPDPARKGATFRLWVRRLEQCGYTVEWRVESAADSGVPTIRRRLFLIARCDGMPIVWEGPTHAPRKIAAAKGLKPYERAADCIDFTRPCPSIFATQEELKAAGIKAKRPLEEATLRRIAKGVERYVIGAAEPFVGQIANWSRDSLHSAGEPLRTVTAYPKGGSFAVVAPHITKFRAGAVGHDMRDPLATVTANSFEKRPGGAVPLGVAAAMLTKFSENSIGHLPDEPLHTVMAGAPRHGLVSAFLEQANTGLIGRAAVEPVSTIVSKSCTQRVIAAALSHAYTSNTAGGMGDPREPAKTITAGGNHHYLLELPMRRPFSPHGDELRAFLVKYYGAAEAADIADPLHSVTSRARFGLVMVAGEVFQISDIGMRMLWPDELKAAQGFPKHYVTGWSAIHGPITKTSETMLIGNSVSPKHGAKHIRANLAGGAWKWRVAA